MSAINTNTANFTKDVLSADQPVLVDFWASWCGPCRQMGPAVDQLADEYAGRAKIVKVNIDESPELAGEYGVRSIPHFAVFENGQFTRQTGGSMPKDVLARLLEQPANA